MRITRQIETEKYIVYRRDKNGEKGVPLYFAYNKETEETENEFRSIVQARKFIERIVKK